VVSKAPSAYIELIAIHFLQIYRDRIPPRVVIIHVTYSMRRQVDLPILVIWNLVFPNVSSKPLLLAHDALRSLLSCPSAETTYPSYSPTLSWTKMLTSSGKNDGLSAVVRSRCFRNIRPSHVLRILRIVSSKTVFLTSAGAVEDRMYGYLGRSYEAKTLLAIVPYQRPRHDSSPVSHHVPLASLKRNVPKCTPVHPLSST
jgi:hypothetical protein